MTTEANPPVVAPDHRLPAHVRPPLPLKRIAMWAALSLLVLLVIVLWIRHEKEAHKAPPPPTSITVTTATAHSGDIGNYLQSIGTVTPVYTASITSQVTGIITAVHYQEGARVNQGDPLIDVDARPYRATLLQAEGALERDRHLLAQARMDLERYRQAWTRNAIAKQTVDDQEKLVLQDIGTVQNDEGTVEYAEVQVRFCHITAPISGRVGLRLVDPGNVVQATGSVVLAVVTQLEPITVVFTIPEDNVGAVWMRLNRMERLSVDAFDRAAQRKIASGVLLTLDNQIDTTTGTVKGRAMFANSDDALFPNQFVNARLLLEMLHGVTLIPAVAIQQNGPESFVYVIDGSVARVRQVKPGVTDDGVAQVDGVRTGEVVATSGFERLHDQAHVSAAPAGAASNGSAIP
jgi:membrane fusion protein, multidrug efflux system